MDENIQRTRPSDVLNSNHNRWRPFIRLIIHSLKLYERTRSKHGVGTLSSRFVRHRCLLDALVARVNVLITSHVPGLQRRLQWYGLQHCWSAQRGRRRSSLESRSSGNLKARVTASRSCEAVWPAGTHSVPAAPASNALASRRSRSSGKEGAPAATSRRRSARLRNITCRRRGHKSRGRSRHATHSRRRHDIARRVRALDWRTQRSAG